MTEPEFRDWLKHHFARFTAAAGWLGRFPTAPRHEGDPTQRSVIDAWRFTLGDVNLDDAKRASDALASGDETFSEKTGFDHHPKDVRRIARGRSGEREAKAKTNQRLHRFEGEPTYRCLRCRDDGFLIVIHDTSLRAAREIVVGENGERRTNLHHPQLNPEGRTPIYSLFVRCNCEAGYRWRGMSRVMRESDVLWPIERDANYHAALAGAERQREAGQAACEWHPDPSQYAGEIE